MNKRSESHKSITHARPTARPQAQVQKARKDRPGTGSGSKLLRIDIPKNDVPEENQRRDGVEYFDGKDERFSDHRPADKLLNEIFGKPGR